MSTPSTADGSAGDRAPAALLRAGGDLRLEPLWRSVHARLSTGRPAQRVTVGPWSAEELDAVADLLGCDRHVAPGHKLALAAIDRALGGEGDQRRLRQVAEAVVGPVDDLRGRRAAERADRQELWAWLESWPAVLAEPALLDWVALVRRGGLVAGSVARTRQLLEQALAVLSRLPAEGIGLPVLADKVAHDPHALDDGERLSGTVLQALACLTAPGSVDVLAGQLLDGTEARRALWRRFGVETDALSSTILVAGLHPSTVALQDDGCALAVLHACAAAGEAAVLTLAQVRSLRPRTSLGGPAAEGQGQDGVVAGHGHTPLVHVVENPSVLAAALTRFGTGCPPLVCTSGWPSAAGMVLLRRLRTAGARLRYHGDLDGDGLRIASHLLARVGAEPWRMSAADYDAALRRRSEGPAAGRVTDVPWDDQLGPVMRARGRAVTEESVVDDLLEDLLVASVCAPRPRASG
ncbi:MAG TPA: TIGR02679 family protein [Kineosporiaceae bacterium]